MNTKKEQKNNSISEQTTLTNSVFDTIPTVIQEKKPSRKIQKQENQKDKNIKPTFDSSSQEIFKEQREDYCVNHKKENMCKANPDCNYTKLCPE